MALGRKDDAGFWVCRWFLGLSLLKDLSCLRSSAPAYPANAPEPRGLFLLHRLHPDVLLGVRELLLRQKAQGGPRGPRAAVWEVPRFPSESEDVESGAEVG